jgi:phage host-nuclease inhibitor protein Gam
MSAPDLRARLALAQTAVRWAQTSEQRAAAMREVEELKAEAKRLGLDMREMKGE